MATCAHRLTCCSIRCCSTKPSTPSHPRRTMLLGVAAPLMGISYGSTDAGTIINSVLGAYGLPSLSQSITWAVYDDFDNEYVFGMWGIVGHTHQVADPHTLHTRVPQARLGPPHQHAAPGHCNQQLSDRRQGSGRGVSGRRPHRGGFGIRCSGACAVPGGGGWGQLQAGAPAQGPHKITASCAGRAGVECVCWLSGVAKTTFSTPTALHVSGVYERYADTQRVPGRLVCMAITLLCTYFGTDTAEKLGCGGDEAKNVCCAVCFRPQRPV